MTLSKKKFVLMGLDNSGKSSIILCLMGVKNLHAFSKLKPTISRSWNKFDLADTEFTIWDFGGQEQYRSEYLANFQENFKQTDKFIFVIDIQDVERYDIALDYLSQIIHLFHKNKLKVDLSIFLHKYDPDLHYFMPEFSEDNLNVLINKIDKVIDKSIDYNLFKTTIFTTFRKLKIE
ncbi:MAG: hypothetical protein EU533_04590 [Promethearchaeota archaeon]|nr:MAG: hypothetical protein EU533_04590 [Candidatus Lokiarchaeota archaeon]